MPLSLKHKLPEEVKLFDSNDQFVDAIKLPFTDPGDWPRTVQRMGKLYREGGGPDAYYKLGEFYEVPANG